jgi:antitoxin PrlF
VGGSAHTYFLSVSDAIRSAVQNEKVGILLESKEHIEMKNHVATISSKGQVTIPKEIRRELGVSAPDKVLFSTNADGEVVLRPVRLKASDLLGIFPAIPGREDEDIDEIIKAAMDEKAEEVVANLWRP